VKTIVFFEVLDLLNLRLKEVDKKLLVKIFSHPTESSIEYKNALAYLTINLELPDPLSGFWVLRLNGKRTEN
jgi:hypothetical protein